MNKYKIADLTVTMSPMHSPLLPQSETYLWHGEEEPVCHIALTERAKAWYAEHYHTNDESLMEYMETGAIFYQKLLEHQGFLLHASAVCVDHKAYLFSAPSGTGKSTHTSLYLQNFRNRAYIINDDKPAIRNLNGTFYAYGTPWSGKTRLNRNVSVPIQGIAFLSRSETNDIRRMSDIEAVSSILSQTIRPRNKLLAELLLERIDEFVKKVPIYSLSCNMQPNAAILSYEVMSKGEIK